MSFMTKNQVTEAYKALEALGKRSLPTLDTILKFAHLKSVLRPFVEEADSVRTMLIAGADHILHPATGQSILSDPDQINADLFAAMQGPAQHTGVDFVDPGIRIVKADLPKLPDFSEDAEKNKKFEAARAELANEIASLGAFFTYE